MVIPRRFQLFAHDITVEYDKNLSVRDQYVGRSTPQLCKIVLQPANGGITRTQVEQTYFHELVHIILNNMERDDLSGDERFVDVFASLLLQATVTSEGDIDTEIQQCTQSS